MSKPGRKATCQKCGQTFIARAKGPIPRTCISCDPNKSNRSKRRTAAKGEARPKITSAIVAPGVGGVAEARALQAMPAFMTAVHYMPAGGDIERAARLAGLVPEALDLDELRAEVEGPELEDVREQTVEGMLRVGRMAYLAYLARMGACAGDVPMNTLGSSMKALTEALLRAQPLFGGSYGDISVVLDESDDDVA